MTPKTLSLKQLGPSDNDYARICMVEGSKFDRQSERLWFSFSFVYGWRHIQYEMNISYLNGEDN